MPYVQAAAFKAVVEQQSDPQLVALMKGVDYRKAVDNGTVDRLVKEGFFEKLFGRTSDPSKSEKPNSL